MKHLMISFFCNKSVCGGGDKKYCESNHIYYIIIITITIRNGWLGTPMGGWEPKSSLPFCVTQLRGYAYVIV